LGGRWWGAFCESAEEGADRSEIGPYQESWVGKVDGSGIGMTWARADGTRRVAYRGALIICTASEFGATIRVLQ
jgi:hypothetical protein